MGILHRHAPILLLGVAILATPPPALSGFGERYCGREGFRCLSVAPGDRWETLFPEAKERDLALRLNRMNVPPRAGQRIAVPVNPDEVDELDLAPFERVVARAPTNRIVVEQAALAWAAYDASGRLVRWGPMSGGKKYCPDLKRGCRTRPGRFTVYAMRGADCVSNKFPIGRGGAKMPYCMFYSGGYAIHGSHSVPGYHASHGCVRIFVEDARWLYRHFVRVGETQVLIDQGL